MTVWEGCFGFVLFEGIETGRQKYYADEWEQKNHSEFIFEREKKVELWWFFFKGRKLFENNDGIDVQLLSLNEP